MVRGRRGSLKGSDTVLGKLLEHNTDGSLTDQQLFAIAIHLLIAGNETTTNLPGGMFDTLARNPEQYDSFGAANRDPLAFDNPDEYRADRNPRTHVAFGYGAHMCLGAPLARMEAQAVLRELVTHVSRISATGQTIWSTHSSLRGPTHLPIHLTPD